jgi:hypothetical protein
MEKELNEVCGSVLASAWVVCKGMEAGEICMNMVGVTLHWETPDTV